MAEIEKGEASNDLATKIMTAKDPLTGDLFDTDERIDQVAIFFLAGHETGASALAWALYLMAIYPEWQEKLAEEAIAALESPDFSVMLRLKISRDVFRETLRLYPGARDGAANDLPGRVSQTDRARWIADRAQPMVSPPKRADLGRSERVRSRSLTDGDRQSLSTDRLYPFSAGSRVCSGAGFAMVEGVLLLSS